MTAALILSFGVVFVAELGDRSQLMAMMFAMRYRSWMVIGAITTATAAIHLMSVVVGHYLGASIPAHLTSVVAGLAMIVFGLWTIRGDSIDSGPLRPTKVGASAFFAVTVAFFLAELGDKTMFTTIALATDNNWFGVWIGSTLGMVAADALAILVGAAMARNLPPHIISRGAATLFFGFGAWLLYEGLQGAGTALIVGVVALTAVIVIVGVAVIRRQRAGEAKADTDAEANTDAESGTSAVGELAPAR
ncbi:MAG TPA: TMEM165/GDT1 family protein [Gordonia sp. (in: high G+C Gram-positive bacteria)]|uniref:TMEM165/GDT1 family protein n=1 Tax=unclassified Gordonia (in: high G+C Gram-positive bacteria) TaxID=2657482 RepID=UPI000FC309CF|nr:MULTISPECIES: TMEM165/GDT1 family protein [unclassified Gordonia (in: high G+C Gram-positive bacteria)]RUP40290.1 MAG: TMEM165/GDT1 family protein [Gordonia sp. (in: high G+C Gram-positive bacteria)]HNP57244.1 TMEM165/GDT1 family protein [Gordonia sp. (in: high G+C Gram-positive bacteria)]HRC49308.1 TMEM165/GDT1 family protein [Gordonia sp. (in: high G+C Gram-positive bacteria)]